MASSMGEHLKRIRRPGKAIVISDFFVPPSSYQQGLNLLRGVNLDISVIQVLSREEMDPPFPIGGLAVMDSETDGQVRIQWGKDARRQYRENLARHNLELKSSCHQAGVHYSLFVTDQDLSGFVLGVLPAIGLLK